MSVERTRIVFLSVYNLVLTRFFGRGTMISFEICAMSILQYIKMLIIQYNISYQSTSKYITTYGQSPFKMFKCYSIVFNRVLPQVGIKIGNTSSII